MKKLIFALLLLPVSSFAQGTATNIRNGSTLPTACANGDIFYKTTAPIGAHECSVPGNPGTWRRMHPSASSFVTALFSGTCNSSSFLRGDGACATPPGTGPGGSNTDVQINDSGSLYGDSGFTYTKATKSVGIGDGSTRGMISILGAAGAPSGGNLPPTGTCGWYYNTTTGKVGWVDHSGTDCGPSTSSGTVTSSGSPSSGNIPKFTTSTNIAPAAASDVVALFSTCSGTQYLGADGSCHTASGGSGALTLLEEHTASGSTSLDFTTRNVTGQSGNTFQSDFDDYQIEIIDIIPATNSTDFNLECSSDNGSTWDTTSGHYLTLIAFSASGTLANGSTGTTTKIQLAGINSSRVSNGAANGQSGSLKLYNPLSTATQKKFAGQLTYFDTSASAFVNEIGIMAQYTQSGTACTALRFVESSGNLTSGTVRIYGIAK